MKSKALLFIALTVTHIGSVFSANFNVSTNSSSDLISAINSLNTNGDEAGNTITFTDLTGDLTIVLSENLPVILKPVRFVGAGISLMEQILTDFFP